MTDIDEPDADDYAQAADKLAEAGEALRWVDLNVLFDDDVRTVLDAKDDLLEVCLRLRDEQRRCRRRHEQGEDGDCS